MFWETFFAPYFGKVSGSLKQSKRWPKGSKMESKREPKRHFLDKCAM